MPDLFVLVDRKPVPCSSMVKWSVFMANEPARRVGDDRVGKTRVSTVFLGLDHAHGFGPAMLFETMCFGGPLDLECRRSSTWDQAETQHADMVARARGFKKVKVEP